MNVWAFPLLVVAIEIQQGSGLAAASRAFDMNGQATTSSFPFVHPDIAAVLNCRPSMNDEKVRVEPDTLEIIWEASYPTDEIIPVSTQHLVDLAHACDRVIYQRPLDWESQPMKILAEMGETSHTIVAATLLALNRLESAIRRSTGYAAGSAPLLKNMIKELSNRSVAAILTSLLLPTPGLNLRNLLWHGFCGSDLPRPWLALVLIITKTVEKSCNNKMMQQDQLQFNDILKLHPAMTMLLKDQKDTTESATVLRGWLPESHLRLLELAFLWKYTKPACSMALLAVILEHGLRLDWCRVNQSHQDAIARPGAYYVTLDGHGQKHQHDLILYPYFAANIENKLISHLGGSTVAILTDLFASPCGGPNIRAALAHGLWDSQLERELACDEHDHSLFVDMVDLVIIAMEGAALSPRPLLRQYRPVFSYRASALRNLEGAITQLARLSSLRTSRLTTVTMVDNDLIGTLKDITFDELSDKVLDTCQITSGEWKAEHVFEEYYLNVALATLGASCTLLGDVAVAASTYACRLEQILLELEREDDLNHRRRRRLQRMCSVADIAIILYRFAAYVALVSLHQAMHQATHHRNGTYDGEEALSPEIMLKAVERSRMCVSTVSTFLISNADRAIKAAVDYTKGNAVKAVLQYGQRPLQRNRE